MKSDFGREKLSLYQFRVLLAAGYTPEQIGFMNAAEITNEVNIAIDQGVMAAAQNVEYSKGK